VTDAGCLTRTAVYGVVRPRGVAQVRQALAFAEEHDLVVSVAGTLHALGGQAAHPGALVLDMRALDTVEVDAARRTATVQAGATWHRVLEAVHPAGLSVATMPSIDILSVGGTVSVNAHGVDFRAGSLSSTIRSLRVMLADGTVHRVSREQEPDLFRAVVGGYGLLGVVLDVELDLVESETYRLRDRVVGHRDLPAVFAAEIAGDERVRMTYTHLSTSPDSLLREAIVYTYERVDPPEPVPELRTRGSDRLGRLLLNVARTGAAGQRVKWAVQRDVLPHVRGCLRARNDALRESEACMVARNQAMYESLGLLRHRLPQYTDVLQEYFLPHDRLVPFLDELRGELGTHDAALLNASVRSVRRQDVLLDYAQGDRFSVVLYLSQRVGDRGDADMADLTRRLVAAALDHGGTFYLPYQQHYTRDQVRRSYPALDEFVAVKRAHDPDLRFRNSFWARYA
jgi:FAD/FMN-containing dehydrogenase